MFLSVSIILLCNIKTAGLSYRGIEATIALINKELNNKGKRASKFAASATAYLREEAAKLPNREVIYNASSDIMESIFGCYKLRKSKNNLAGVTAYALIIPLITKMNDSGKGIDTNFKANLEDVYLRDLYLWKKTNQRKNQAIKYINKLAT